MMLCFQVFDNILLAQEKVSESKISAMNLMEVGGAQEQKD